MLFSVCLDFTVFHTWITSLSTQVAPHARVLWSCVVLGQTLPRGWKDLSPSLSEGFLPCRTEAWNVCRKGLFWTATGRLCLRLSFVYVFVMLFSWCLIFTYPPSPKLACSFTKELWMGFVGFAPQSGCTRSGVKLVSGSWPNVYFGWSYHRNLDESGTVIFDDPGKDYCTQASIITDMDWFFHLPFRRIYENQVENSANLARWSWRRGKIFGQRYCQSMGVCRCSTELTMHVDRSWSTRPSRVRAMAKQWQELTNQVRTALADSKNLSHPRLYFKQV